MGLLTQIVKLAIIFSAIRLHSNLKRAMRIVLFTLLLLPTFIGNAKAPESFTIFAKAYGPVRYFYPSADLQKVDWDRFLLESIDTLQKLGAAGNALAVEQQFRSWGFDVHIYNAPKVTNSNKANLPKHKKFWYYRGYGEEYIDGKGFWMWLYRKFGPYGTHYLKPKKLEYSDTCDVAFGEHFWEVQLSDSVWMSIPYQPKRIGKHLHKGKIAITFPEEQRNYIDVVEIWNILYNYYPYQLPISWDEMLAKGFAIADGTESRDYKIRHYLSFLPDGHCRVYSEDVIAIGAIYRAPIHWDFVEGKLIVTNYDTTLVPINCIGMEVIEIDNYVTEYQYELADKIVTGATPAYRKQEVLHVLRTGLPGDSITLRMVSDNGQNTLTITLPYTAKPFEGYSALQRSKITLPDTICYFDLSIITQKELEEQLEDTLCKAVIFELRGYPNMGFRSLISWLAKTPAMYPLFGVRDLNTPSPACGSTFMDTTWVKPTEHALKNKRVIFLTNEVAISAAETLLMTVKHNKLATIIGSPTAGSNGNMVTVLLPGYYISFTGMETLNQDGSLFHGIGVLPDVEVRPTLQGLKAGRDEVLEYAIQYLQNQ